MKKHKSSIQTGREYEVRTYSGIWETIRTTEEAIEKGNFSAYGGWHEGKVAQYGQAKRYATLQEPMPQKGGNVEVLRRDLLAMCFEIHPSLDFSSKWERNEGHNAHWIDPGLLQSGDPRPAFERVKKGSEAMPTSKDGGAFKVLICTDVATAGGYLPSDSATVATVLLDILGQIGPVEIWIQQGWLGSYGGGGVSLFKLEMPGEFNPKTLEFWISSEWKDSPFSSALNHQWSNTYTGTARKPEIPCDIWLHSMAIEAGSLYAVRQSFDSCGGDYVAFKQAHPAMYKKLLEIFSNSVLALVDQCRESKETA